MFVIQLGAHTWLIDCPYLNRMLLQEIIKNTLLNLVYEICCKCKYCLVISDFSKFQEMEEIVWNKSEECRRLLFKTRTVRVFVVGRNQWSTLLYSGRFTFVGGKDGDRSVKAKTRKAARRSCRHGQTLNVVGKPVWASGYNTLCDGGAAVSASTFDLKSRFCDPPPSLTIYCSKRGKNVLQMLMLHWVSWK